MENHRSNTGFGVIALIGIAVVGVLYWLVSKIKFLPTEREGLVGKHFEEDVTAEEKKRIEYLPYMKEEMAGEKDVLYDPVPAGDTAFERENTAKRNCFSRGGTWDSLQMVCITKQAVIIPAGLTPIVMNKKQKCYRMGGAWNSRQRYCVMPDGRKWRTLAAGDNPKYI